MKNRLNRTRIPLYFARPKNAGAALLFAVLALCRPENTAALTEGDFQYVPGEGETALILRYRGSAADLIIPDTLGGNPVTEITLGAFESQTTLQSVSFPDSLAVIDHAAFVGCSGLTQITIPAGVDFIGESVFRNCTKLETALFEGHAPNTFGPNVFDGAAAGFKVRFYEGASGFTTPAWKGYPSESIPSPSPFSVWRTENGFTADDLTAANGEPLLIAYALNLDPEDSAARLPLPVVESGAFRLDFPADRAGVSLMVERSTDPVSGVWEAAGVTTNSGTGSVSVPLSGSESPEKLYLRFTAAEQTE